MESTVEHVAVRAVRRGGRVLRERFRAADDDADYGETDAKAAADRAAEEAILPVIRDAYPEHAVYAEEAGAVAADGPLRWTVDPLDGTNNFLAGIPVFAAAVAVAEGERTVLSAVYAPVTDDLYVARQGEGARHDGTRVRARTDRDPAVGTFGFVIGRGVKRDGRAERAAALRETLDGRVKRVVDSWAPTVHVGLLARGRLDGMVTFHPDREEERACDLLARAAGAAVAERGPLTVYAANPDAATPLADALAGQLN